MPSYKVTLNEEETHILKKIIQKGGKGYRIKHARSLLKLDEKPENKRWTYEHIKETYGTTSTTIANVAKRFVMDGLESALGRKQQENRHRKVTGEIEAQICTIACSQAPN
jgi:hypothetical protein